MGYAIGENLYFEDEQEVKKLHNMFEIFIKNREERQYETKRESVQIIGKEFSFSPVINATSLALANEHI